MPGTVIGITMNQGYPGTYARNSDCIISNRQVSTIAPTLDKGPSFGDPVVLIGNATSGDNNTIQSVADYIASGTNQRDETFAIGVFLGVAVREVKTYTTYLTVPVGGDSPTATGIGGYSPGQFCDVLERGTISAVCNVGTPVAGGKVYVRVATGSGPSGYVIGGFEYRNDTDSSSCVLITNAEWTTGLIDANKVCELTLTTRNNLTNYA